MNKIGRHILLISLSAGISLGNICGEADIAAQQDSEQMHPKQVDLNEPKTDGPTPLNRSELVVVAEQFARLNDDASKAKRAAAEHARVREDRLKRIFAWIPTVVVTGVVAFVVISSKKELKDLGQRLLKSLRLYKEPAVNAQAEMPLFIEIMHADGYPERYGQDEFDHVGVGGRY